MARKKSARGKKRRTAAAELPRRRRKKVETQIAFDAIVIEGGILSPEWLARAAQQEAPDQSPDSYRVPKGLELRDEVGRYWRIAQAKWKELEAARDKSVDDGATAKTVATRFVVGLLRDCFGFGTLTAVDPVEKDERLYPVGHAALGGRVPVVIAPLGAGVDGQEARSVELGDGPRKRNAFGLTQEYLNASDEALWGLCSDGLTLRLLRDNASLTRPAWMEADLDRIFTEDRFADFTALWLILHETRFGSADHAPSECALEKWREAGREEGTRARDQLRHGVEESLQILGQGFIEHPDNEDLRTKLHDGSLTKEAYFQELLRVVYRIIFLLTAEERGVLHPPGVSEATKKLYAEGYGLRRLRDRAVKRSSHDRFHDGWEGVKVVFGGLDRGEPALGLPALLGLFAKDQCPNLDQAKLHNRASFPALFRLSWLREDGGLARVNWRDMGPEELGSVYESLLELVPHLTEQGRRFGFATGAETAGNERKQTGSYYTPDSLVQCLLDSALDPVVDRTVAENPGREVEALLELTVVDPACGSGHFLLAAARRIADRIAKIEADGTPSAEEYRHALRRVVSRCVYGVDLNPMAVELCKVGLWMEAVEPGRPLSFLDAHIQHGNALLGTTPELMDAGIPDDAWKPIEGDDKEIAKALKKRNKEEVKQDVLALRGDAEAVRTRAAELEAKEDEDVESLNEKARAWLELVASEPFRHEKLVADAWCAAFVWLRTDEMPIEAAPTNGVWRQLRAGAAAPPEGLTETVDTLAREYTFFHWHLAFPQVFARGGFDLLVGNPPWDSLLFREQEFFAQRRPEIARAPTAAVRKRMISALAESDPVLFAEYSHEQRRVAGINAFVRNGPFPLCGVGRVNLFGLFAELGRRLLRNEGRGGQILPTGIVTDDSTKLFFQRLMDDGALVSLFDFENQGIFAGVHSSYKFSLVTVRGGVRAETPAEFVFFAHKVDDITDPERRFQMSAEDVRRLNPQTRTAPVFRTRQDADLNKRLYASHPALRLSDWEVAIRRLINSADDSRLFRSELHAEVIPLYEGKHFHLFNHRWLHIDTTAGERPVTEAELRDPGFEISTRYTFPLDEAKKRFGYLGKGVIAIRKIARTTDERTSIVALVPTIAVSDSAKIIESRVAAPGGRLVLLGILGSLAFDYLVRQKLGGANLSSYIIEQVAIVSLQQLLERSSLSGLSDYEFIRRRVLELVFTSHALIPLRAWFDYDGPPFSWEAGRRAVLETELNAFVFHMYGFRRDQVEFVLDTFPIIRRRDEQRFGDYRTKLMILDIFDRMGLAIKSGGSEPFVSELDPPPASPQVAHPAVGRRERA